MRTASRPESSTRQPSSWLVVMLGLAAYVGLTYGLAVLPVQLEVPLPHWGAEVVPPLVYGLLVLLCVRRLSILRWLIGTAVLSGVHYLLTLATGPLTVLLEPRLAGRPLPWVLPPPLPELVGAILLLVPLRDLLRAPFRSGRAKPPATAGSGTSGYRGRDLVTPRLQQAAPAEGTGSLSEALLTQRGEPMPTLAPTPVLAGAGIGTDPYRGAVSTIPETSRTRPVSAPSWRPRDERVQLTGAQRDILRIALDHIMDQLPPGTFLAPEDEVAASLTDPGYLLIPAKLVVGQLAEGMARVAWSDIADQFPRHLVGLSNAEISAHLKDGIRLHLDEVVSQLPHDLFVADSPEPDIRGLNEIPAPFQPVEAAPPAASVSRSPVPATPAARRAPAGPSIEELALSVLETTARPPRPEPAPGGTAALEATLRIPFDRVASELPADAFRVPLEQIAAVLREPGCLLVSRSLVLPQLAEGQIRVSWEEVAPQFPLDQMTLSEAEMGQRLKGGIRLPLDEVIRQLPPDMFLTAGAAPDVRGIESFPAPFQPLVSDPAPAPPRAEPAVETEPVSRAEAEAAPAVAPVPEARPLVSIETAVEPEPPRPPEQHESPTEPVQRATDVALEPVSAGSLDGRSAPAPPAEEVPVDRPETAEPEPDPKPWVVEQPAPTAQWQEHPASVPLSVPGGPTPVELDEARKIAALLAPAGPFDVTIQSVEGVTVFAVASPGVPQEVAAAVAGLLRPLIGEERAPWPIDQLTFRGSDTALILTPLGRTGARGPLLVACVPRGGSLALIEILSRRAAADGERPAPANGTGAGARDLGRLLAGDVGARARALEASLGAFGPVSVRALRDAAGESALCLFLPSGSDERAVGAFALDIHSVMRKAAGAGTTFRTAVVRSGRQLMVIQPEEVAPGRSSIVVAAGEVARPGLAYRQVERAAAALAST